MTWRLAISMALFVGCGEPAAAPRLSPPSAKSSTASAPQVAAPLQVDDAPLEALDARTTVDDPLPHGVLAQRAALAAWLDHGSPGPPALVLLRLRAAGLLGLGAADDYVERGRGGSPVVLHEAKVAARRRLGIHRPSFRRLAVVGASVSAGFLGVEVASLLQEAAPEASVIDGSATLYFRKSVTQRRLLLDEVVASAPELTLALDFLFWWTHGFLRDRLEEGLVQLEAIPGLLVLGTVPRMTSAETWIMSRVRSAEDLALVNRRITEWAAARPRVILVPLAQWYATREAEVRALPGDPAISSRELFAEDGLHLEPIGTRLMVRRTLGEVTAALPDAQCPMLPWSR